MTTAPVMVEVLGDGGVPVVRVIGWAAEDLWLAALDRGWEPIFPAQRRLMPRRALPLPPVEVTP